MRRTCGLIVCVLGLGIVPGWAQQAPKSLLEDAWDAAYLNGTKAGFVHTTAQRIEGDTGAVIRTTVDLQLTVKRFNDTARLRMVTGTDETPEGRVTRVTMRQYLGKDQQLVVTGTVDGDRLHVKVDGRAAHEKDVPWDNRVIGLYRQEHLFAEKHVKPGDTLTYLSYEPTVVAVVRTRVRVQEPEELSAPGMRGGQPLLRAEVSTDKIQGVQLPPLTLWLNDQLLPVRSEVEMPGLGKMTLYRTTKALAMRPSAGGRQTDLGFDQLIPVHRRILRPYDTTSAVYRITLRGEEDPGTAFARDSRQQVTNVQGDSFELHVHAVRRPRSVAVPAAQAPAEFLQSCYFINSDDERVRELAQEAVGGQTIDVWTKAQRIERWVHDHMRNQNFTENFATADHVARTLEGDCTEHAMLAAAMCRAVGVPSRTAVGLVYVDGPPHGPAFGFHMWTEVWIRGEWVPIDATLGRNYVGATHLKVLDHSWHDVQSMAPLLPLLRVVGKASIEVLSVDGSD